MTYDDFSAKLRQIQAEYFKEHGSAIETIAELELVLSRRLTKPRKSGLRSLKGILT